MRYLSTTNDRSPWSPPPWVPPKYVLPQDLQDAIDYVSSLWPKKLPPPTPKAECLIWMLKALKTATEAYLEEPVQHIIVTGSVPLESSDIYKETLDSATSTLGLKLGMPTFLSARAAAVAYGIKGACPDSYDPNPDDNRLFVALSHNRASFSASLLEEECNYYDELRKYHNKTLGSASDIPREERYAELKHALEDIIKEPYPGKWGSSEIIHDVVTCGEATDDEVLRSGLEEVFGSELETLEAETQQTGMQAIDPLFAGSRGAAKECTEWNVDWHGPYGCPI
ncbi:hypothetical protein QM012_003676 [Aureobasidium pullulans]|uniref:Actin-like ATPase domain-containing protein n=1 Tax=Aureobasidium pullulans TaxID=5580 RepID=A0ABR0T8R7_AURPU